MALELEAMTAVSSIVDVAQVAAETAEKSPAWLGGLLGMAVVMTALISIWLATSLVGSYFNKKASSPGKTEAAPKAPAAAQASAAAGDDIPLAAIVAAAAYTVSAMGQQLRNIVVHVPGRDSVSWASQGRQTIYAGHSAKAPQAVASISSVVKK
jgi:Na+-transporting methylmalonyl-CoA/oxaloacetate decarboxylase gamma subunit